VGRMQSEELLERRGGVLPCLFLSSPQYL
jgi:hypothetical protein